eukprot:7982489-Pyramimonas_sp.AAC.1
MAASSWRRSLAQPGHLRGSLCFSSCLRSLLQVPISTFWITLPWAHAEPRASGCRSRGDLQKCELSFSLGVFPPQPHFDVAGSSKSRTGGSLAAACSSPTTRLIKH